MVVGHGTLESLPRMWQKNSWFRMSEGWDYMDTAKISLKYISSFGVFWARFRWACFPGCCTEVSWQWPKPRSVASAWDLAVRRTTWICCRCLAQGWPWEVWRLGETKTGRGTDFEMWWFCYVYIYIFLSLSLSLFVHVLFMNLSYLSITFGFDLVHLKP
jgi:hypothetical protein